MTLIEGMCSISGAVVRGNKVSANVLPSKTRLPHSRAVCANVPPTTYLRPNAFRSRLNFLRPRSVRAFEALQLRQSALPCGPA